MSNSYSIAKFHENCFGTPPTPEHCQLYDAYPASRGYSDRKLNRERFRAAFVLALYQTIVFGQKKTAKSYLIIPRAHDAWVTKEMRSLIQEIFDQIKVVRASGKDVRGITDYITGCIKSLLIGHLAFQLSGEPEHWSVFGISSKDPVPEWIPDRLLHVEKPGRSGSDE